MTLKTSDQLIQIEKRLEEIEKWKKTAKILCDQSKKPHACPVCKGMCEFAVFGKDKTAPCPACEGKGIVWD